MRLLKLLLILLAIGIVSCKKKDSKDIKVTTTPHHKKVIGFHPYQNEGLHQRYDYDQLSALAYTSVALDPASGELLALNNWEKTTTIDSMLSKGGKVYITIQLRHLSEAKESLSPSALLKNKTIMTKSITNIQYLLDLRKADGVVFDLDNLDTNDSAGFTKYMISLACQLKPDQELLIILPAVQPNYLDIYSLNQYVDSFILSEKGYWDTENNTVGPVAPIRSKKNSIRSSVKNYLALGVPKEKLILSVPYYGSLWKITQKTDSTQAATFLKYLTYKNIKNAYPQKVKYDSLAKSAYIEMVVDGSQLQLWFDNPQTLAAKYDFVNQNDLGGVALSYLGHDDGYAELWNLLDEKFNQQTASK
ncbi:glycosyl hydrolase family 18 protein [Aquimarina brevivitae]|uniref:Glycosyl hydrolase family 18 (Putative chitinase) n=1 Tax=Aquimarina brevivitae TaxID=323412 RepID=A0A4Q7PH04_9FLAO|nr:glycosyl hydrolase family 18 protein [Aquimarina brevivitae]RZS99208.1 glycosyl hydrolase family 18 (putative chitinase) [Aquimarina brevivitae]